MRGIYQPLPHLLANVCHDYQTRASDGVRFPLSSCAVSSSPPQLSPWAAGRSRGSPPPIWLMGAFMLWPDLKWMSLLGSRSRSVGSPGVVWAVQQLDLCPNESKRCCQRSAKLMLVVEEVGNANHHKKRGHLVYF